MINPKEIRIGNWLCYKHKASQIVEVTGIISDKFWLDDETGVIMFKENDCSGHTDNYSELHPIAITGDILQKAGFAKYSLAGYKEHFSYSKAIGGEMINITGLHDSDFSIRLHDCARNIISVHDLQNKIFAITGEELEISF